MYLTTLELNKIYLIINSQGLSVPATRFLVSTMEHYEKHHGITWLVGRMKLVKSALLRGDLTGLKNSKNLLTGPWKQLHILFNSSRRGMMKALRILNLYGRWESPPATEDDFIIFQKQVSPKNTLDFALEDFQISKIDRKRGLVSYKKSKYSEEIPQSDSKVVPFTRNFEADTTASDHYELLQDYCPNILREFKPLFDRFYEVNEWDDYSYSIGGQLPSESDESSHLLDVVGKIACLTKDRGMKKRFIANPHRFIQIALSRLQSACSIFLKTQPNSLVFNQEKGVEWVRDKLANGHQMWSLDLSAATDHFPLELQEKALIQLFPKLEQDIKLWVKVSRSLWETPHSDIDIRYTRGQPMGTAPSFAAFTLTHALLVKSIGGTDQNFRIIGDDIVISDGKLAKAYILTMEKIKVQINMSKSILNSNIAEFAGRIIDRHGKLPVYKASPRDIRNDPMGYFRQYGSYAKRLLPKKKFFENLGKLSKIPGIGVDHQIDNKTLESLDVLDYLEVMETKSTPIYERRYARPQLSAFQNVPSPFEKAQQNIAGFRFRSPDNDFLLSEHVSRVLKEDDTVFSKVSAIIRELETSLVSGQTTPEFFEEDRSKHPISYFRKLSKKLLKQR